MAEAGLGDENGIFDAERVPGGNFATILAFFDAELWLRRGFATKMVFFDAGRQLEGRRMPGGYGERLGRDVCQIVGKIDLVSYLNGMGCGMFIYC